MRIDKLAYRALIWTLLLLCTAQVPETTFDFGEVFEDVKLTHTFDIRNIGDACWRSRISIRIAPALRPTQTAASPLAEWAASP